jgi:hypothetical protein
LLDVQEQRDQHEDVAVEECIVSLVEYSDKLARNGVFVKAFLPCEFCEQEDQNIGERIIGLEWSDGQLRKLLEERLKPFVQDADVYDPRTERMHPLRPWCDPREADLFLEGRLVKAAHGKPGALIRKGDELLRLIGREQRLLREEDLVDVLGPWRPPSQETAS